MFRAVEVQNSSPAVFNGEEAIKSSELQCGNREEVEGGDDLAMVVEECESPLSLILVMSSLQTLQVAWNRWFGHVEPELEQFAMDARRSPARILGSLRGSRQLSWAAQVGETSTARTDGSQRDARTPPFPV